MADIGKAYVQIIPKAPGISGQISKILGPGSSKAGNEAGVSIGAGIKKAIIAAGIGAAVAGAVKSAVSEGGKLQQSYGGLETIYGKAAEQAKQFAKEAAQAGISANDYAEQAVSFGASLKQAFGGDTNKAVVAANTAIMDMTDNAAKMGTPIENIQNAYQGFAKQNYTMLDNLKLGYGGTKTEMERLLADAEKISGQKYDISNLGDVYDAIHVVQGELGLTGVAAKEASETFEGSFNAMKAAGSNLLGALALGEDVGPAMSTFVSSFSTFLFDNLIPMIGNVFRSLPEAIGTFISEGGPKLMESAKTLIDGLLTGIETYGPMIIDAIPGVLENIGQVIANNGPALLERGGQLIMNLASGIVSQIPQILSTVTGMLSQLIAYIASNLPAWVAKGAELIGSLAKGLIEAVPGLISFLINTFTTLFPALIESLWNLLKGLGEGIISGLASILSSAATAIGDALKKPINAVKTFLSSAWSAIKSAASSAWNGIKSTASSVWNGIKSAAMKPITALKSALSSAWNGIKSAASSAWTAVKNAITKPIDAARDKVKSIMDKVKSFFPFKIGNILDLKIPHISLSGGKAPWGIAGKGKLPSFHVEWAAQGGLVDGATLIGAGEAGTEAIVPLDPFWKRMDTIEERMASNSGSITINLNYNAGDDANKMLRDLARGVQRYRRAGAF